MSGGPVIIEAALNGVRDRVEQPVVPYSAAELAAEARRCVEAGATIFHLHARGDDGSWTADQARYAVAIRALRDAVPEGLVSITSIRPEGASVDAILALLDALAVDPETTPDLISINLGHIAVWEPVAGARRCTRHFANAYDEIARLLTACSGL